LITIEPEGLIAEEKKSLFVAYNIDAETVDKFKPYRYITVSMNSSFQKTAHRNRSKSYVINFCGKARLER
jgi:hypothetical protein